MKQQSPKATYTFVNPNAPNDLQMMLKRIILEKIFLMRQESTKKQN